MAKWISRRKSVFNKFIKQKINYIHNNPVAQKIVEKPEDYIFSSARNYAELSSEIDVIPVWIFLLIARNNAI